MNNLIWLLLLLGFATKIQADEQQLKQPKQLKVEAKATNTSLPEVKTEVKTVTDTGTQPRFNESKNDTETSNSEDKVQKRGLIDLSYGYGDKFDHGYYIGHNSHNSHNLYDFTTQPPATYPSFPPDFFVTTTTPAPPPPPSSSLEPINLGHTTHIHKTITFYQGIPEPYPVIKHIPVPVEKHVPVAVNVPVPVPVAVEKTVHVPVKVSVKVPVAIPQPYPVVKEVRVPVKVYVDKPYPVYVHDHDHDHSDHHSHHHSHEDQPHYHFEHHGHDHWKLPEKPLEEVHKPQDFYYSPGDDWSEKPLDPPHYHSPHFVTHLEKPDFSDFEKYYSASNKVENNYSSSSSINNNNKLPQNIQQSKPDERRKQHQEYIARPSMETGNKNAHNGQHDYRKPSTPHRHYDRDQHRNKYDHRDSYDHRNHRDHEDNRDRRHKYDRRGHRDQRDQREHRQQQERREGRAQTDEFVLHTNF